MNLQHNPELKEKIKQLLLRMKKVEGEELAKIKREFKNILSQVPPSMIAVVENEMVEEGYSQDDLVEACDIHMELFRENIEKAHIQVSPDHPLAQFQLDHKQILDLMERLVKTVSEAKGYSGFSEAERETVLMEKLVDKLLEAENHNVRQENTLFPVLEKHGIEQPPAIMWREHNEMRDIKKKMKNVLEIRNEMDYSDFLRKLEGWARQLQEQFASHSLKEERILYVAALQLITDEEWKDIKEECDQLGYADLTLNV